MLELYHSTAELLTVHQAEALVDEFFAAESEVGGFACLLENMKVAANTFLAYLTTKDQLPIQDKQVRYLLIYHISNFNYIYIY